MQKYGIPFWKASQIWRGNSSTVIHESKCIRLRNQDLAAPLKGIGYKLRPMNNEVENCKDDLFHSFQLVFEGVPLSKMMKQYKPNPVKRKFTPKEILKGLRILKDCLSV